MAALLFPEDFHAAPDACLDLKEDDLTSGFKAWTIGRNPDCDARIKDGQVSGLHAVISRRFIRKRQPQKGFATVFYIEDQGSRNGIYLNARKLRPYDPEPLHPQDKISFGWPEGRAIFLENCQATANAMAWEQPGWPVYRKKEQVEPVRSAGTVISRHQPELPDTGPELIAWGVQWLEGKLGWWAVLVVIAVGVFALVLLLG